jgi:hypothetical protein
MPYDGPAHIRLTWHGAWIRHMNHGSITDDMDEHIWALYFKVKSAPLVGKMLGIKGEHISRRLRKISDAKGIPLWEAKRTDLNRRIMALYHQGLSVAEISRAIKNKHGQRVVKQAVNMYNQAYGIDDRL